MAPRLALLIAGTGECLNCGRLTGLGGVWDVVELGPLRRLPNGWSHIDSVSGLNPTLALTI